MILSGIEVREKIVQDLKESFSAFSKKPNLVIFQIGNRDDSNQYIEQKRKMGAILGVNIIVRKYPENVTEEEVLEAISKDNKESDISGIIVQLPLPEKINTDKLISQISPSKDVDGLTIQNIRLLQSGDKSATVPATARGVVSLLNYYKIPLSGKKVTVIGRSNLVGKPIALALERLGAKVTVCHRQTKDLIAETRNADIIVSATGVPRLITRNHVKTGQIVIDVGINIIKGGILVDEIATRKFVGDVDFPEVEKIVSAISPVPGGVGPMTVVSLFQNLLDIIKRDY